MHLAHFSLHRSGYLKTRWKTAGSSFLEKPAGIIRGTSLVSMLMMRPTLCEFADNERARKNDAPAAFAYRSRLASGLDSHPFPRCIARIRRSREFHGNKSREEARDRFHTRRDAAGSDFNFQRRNELLSWPRFSRIRLIGQMNAAVT